MSCSLTASDTAISHCDLNKLFDGKSLSGPLADYLKKLSNKFGYVLKRGLIPAKQPSITKHAGEYHFDVTGTHVTRRLHRFRTRRDSLACLSSVCHTDWHHESSNTEPSSESTGKLLHWEQPKQCSSTTSLVSCTFRDRELTVNRQVTCHCLGLCKI